MVVEMVAPMAASKAALSAALLVLRKGIATVYWRAIVMAQQRAVSKVVETVAM